MKEVSGWATTQTIRYRPAAISQFLGCADDSLVAYAKAHHHTVASNEVASPAIKTLKVPGACAAVGIRCVSPYTMPWDELAKFVMQSQEQSGLDTLRH